LFEHDLLGKPLHTFPDHALKQTYGQPRYAKPKTLRREGKVYDTALLGWQPSGGTLVAERYFDNPRTMYVSLEKGG